MKLKILFLMLCSLCSANVYSQLKVKTDGTVKIGSFINGLEFTSDVFAFQLSVDGNTLSSGYWLFSDSEFQKKTIPIDGALGRLLKINGNAFTNSEGVKLNYGFNVQEIKSVFPHLVKSIENSSLFVINYDGFIPVMVEALKEQQRRIDELGKESESHSSETQKDNSHPNDVHFTVNINLKYPDHLFTSSAVHDADSVYVDQAILKLPKTYSESGTPTRLVYYAHGAGSSKQGMVTCNSWFPENNTLIDDSLLANGYAIFDVNGGPVVENMGGSWVVQSAYKAYEYIQQHFNVDRDIFVIGLSMGGLSSTNFVSRHSPIVLAHGMFCPVLDLYRQAWENPWYSTTKQSLARTYNFKDPSGNTWEPEKVKGWNPLYTNSFFNATDTFKIYPVPVKIWHAQKDETVNISGSRKFHRYIQNANGYSELRELQLGDHGLSKGNPVMIRELILFFRRFDK